MTPPAARFALGALTALAVCGAGLAEDSQPSQPTGRRSLYVGASRLQPQADARLRDQDGHWGLSAGLDWRYSRFAAVELDLVDTGQAADMPAVERSGPGGAGARRREHINIDGIAVGLRLIYPHGRLAPYVGAGIGFYAAELSDYGAPAHLFLPSTVAKRKDDGTGTYLALGIEYVVSPSSALRLEYRWLRLQADFGPEFGGPVKIGGGLPSLAYRSLF